MIFLIINQFDLVAWPIADSAFPRFRIAKRRRTNSAANGVVLHLAI